MLFSNFKPVLALLYLGSIVIIKFSLALVGTTLTNPFSSFANVPTNKFIVLGRLRVKDVAYVLDCIKGQDKRDMTSLPDTKVSYADELTTDIKDKNSHLYM